MKTYGTTPNTFFITFRNETVKMFRRNKVYAGIITAAAIPLLVVLANIFALGRGNAAIFREDLFRLALGIFTPVILPLFAVSLVSDAFTDEQSKGSLRTSVLMPDSRTRHFMAKTTGAFTGAAAMAATLWLASNIFGLALPSRGDWLLSAGSSVLQAAGSLFPVIMVIGFAVLGTQFVKSSSGLFLSLAGLVLVMKMSRFFVGNLYYFLPVNWLGYGANVIYAPAGSLAMSLSMMLLWAVFTGGIALLRFERRMV